MNRLNRWKSGQVRHYFCPKCGKRTRMAGLCAKCQKAKEAKEQR